MTLLPIVIFLVPCAAILLGYWSALQDGKRFPVTLPDFVVCSSQDPCHRRIPSTWIPDLLQSVGEQMKGMVEAGRRPLILHIGASGLDNLAEWADMHLYKEVVARLPLRTDEYRLALVEPQAVQAAELADRAKSLGFNRRARHIVSAAVAAWCPERGLLTYGFSEAVARDFGARWRMYRTWIRATRAGLLEAACGGFLAARLSDPGLAGDQRSFGELCRGGNASAYVVEARQTCLTPRQLLDTLGADAGDLAMLVVDAEGEDASIVKELLKMESFRPRLVMFEAKWAEDLEVLVELKLQRYSLGATHYGFSDEEENTVAVLL